MLFFFSGGKDGPVGFADFVYKHIVPACFLAPLKQTFDLADAQTVLVCIMEVFHFHSCGADSSKEAYNGHTVLKIIVSQIKSLIFFIEVPA